MPITLLLVDDHPFLRATVRQFLATQDTVQVIAEATTGGQTLTRYNEVKPDVVILDIGLPDIDGMEVTRRIKSSHATAKIIIVSANIDAHITTQALNAGALAVLPKDQIPTHLIPAILQAAQGSPYPFSS